MTELRPAIIRLFEEGNSGEKIGKLLNISPSTAREVIRRFKATGSYTDRPKNGSLHTGQQAQN